MCVFAWITLQADKKMALNLSRINISTWYLNVRNLKVFLRKLDGIKEESMMYVFKFESFSCQDT